MENLRVSLIQTTLHWEDSAKNRAHFQELMAPLKDRTDLIVLPEMFTTGFTMRSQDLAEPMHGPTLEWMQQQAHSLHACLCGSVIIQDRGAYYNRLVWMRPDGVFATYDKRHLFTLAEEDQFFSPGQEHLLVDLKGWTIAPLICYDLRFPVWSRNTGNTDILIYVANWPQKRSHAWRALLAARAIENQCYTIGVNRIGRDGKEIPYIGDSMIFDYAGNLLHHAAHLENVTTYTLDYGLQEAFRARFPFLKDADRFTIELD